MSRLVLPPRGANRRGAQWDNLQTVLGWKPGTSEKRGANEMSQAESNRPEHVTETGFRCDNCKNGFAGYQPNVVEVLASDGTKKVEWWCDVCTFGKGEAFSRANKRVINKVFERHSGG
jgi:hypothetical protein